MLTGTDHQEGGNMSTADSTAQRHVVVRERLRFARDLHDLLGPRLSAVTLQCELARRMMDSRPQTAREELDRALSGMREVMAEVRQVAHGYHCLSLETEADATLAVLRSAGIRATAQLPPEPLPAPVQTVLATVIREAAANVLRHSRAGRCRTTVELLDGAVRLTMTNDGVSKAAPPAAPGFADLPAGMGLRSLTERVEAVGGRLTHGPVPPHHYTLRVHLP
ncbi:histidine kinase [Streptomyces sp. NBC_01511]|uniref:sensor histidine kinase n=1 Tax=Streptomyces sp. NBC_01511 TaxID=2903889 RepID=UPI00386CDF2F